MRHAALLSLGLLILVAAGPRPAIAEPPRPVVTVGEGGTALRSWLVLGPLDAPALDAIEAAEAIPDEVMSHAWIDAGQVEPHAGEQVEVAGQKSVAWQAVESETGAIDLADALGPLETVAAYAWCGIESNQARSAVLGIGSDDGVQVWLNGKLVHTSAVPRPLRQDEDTVVVDLNKGMNHLLLKVVNIRLDWAFSCRLLDQEQLTERLFEATMTGDLDATRQLLTAGADVAAPGPGGMTAYHVARMRGYQELAQLLADEGADVEAEFPEPATVLDQFLREEVAETGPGLAILVSRDGEILFKKGYGLACLAHRVPATPATKFRIGSVTKQFTAAAILKLQEDGTLSVDDRLSKYVDDFPRGDEVTLHQLLTHTSGIHSYTSKPDFMTRVTSPVEPLDLINMFKDDPFDFEPGGNWQYNNSGYFLLGRIVEVASGKSYGEYLRETFFDPLGMADTGVHDAQRVLTNEATGYTVEDGRIAKALNWNMDWAGGAGALYSTVVDLHRWNEALFAGDLLSPESTAAAWKAYDVPATGKSTNYGYGWSLIEFRGVRGIEHGGGLHGFVSQLARVPSQNVNIVVLMNATPHPSGLSPDELGRRVAELFLWQEMDDREPPTTLVDFDPARLDAYLGRYDYGGPIMTITRTGDRLMAQLSGQSAFEIFPRTETRFFWKVVEAEIEFVADETGKFTKAIHRQGGQTIEAERLPDREEVKLPGEVLEKYVGNYDYGSATLTVTRDGARLYAQMTGQPKFEIFPQAEGVFFWKVVEAEVRFVEDDEGVVEKAIHKQSGQQIEAPRVE